MEEYLPLLTDVTADEEQEEEMTEERRQQLYEIAQQRAQILNRKT